MIQDVNKKPLRERVGKSRSRCRGVGLVKAVRECEALDSDGSGRAVPDAALILIVHRPEEKVPMATRRGQVPVLSHSPANLPVGPGVRHAGPRRWAPWYQLPWRQIEMGQLR